jgi:hypothetical protein
MQRRRLENDDQILRDRQTGAFAKSGGRDLDATSASMKPTGRGAAWIANAELVARQLNSFFDGPSNIPRIAQHMRLPAFRYAALEPYTWPPARK